MKVNNFFEDLIARNPCLAQIPFMDAYELLKASCCNHGKVLVCGNGGSASDAEHIVGELMKGFLLSRPLTEEEAAPFSSFGIEGARLAKSLQRGIPAISLNSQTALITAVGNDNGYSMIFAQQVFVYGCVGDVLLAMSTSGNSTNVVEAARAAKARGLTVLGITGENAGALGALCDVCLSLPARATYQVQEYTVPIYHALCAMLEQDLFGRDLIT